MLFSAFVSPYRTAIARAFGTIESPLGFIQQLFGSFESLFDTIELLPTSENSSLTIQHLFATVELLSTIIRPLY